MKSSDEPPAIPLWIDGHAYLTLARQFIDVRNPTSGAVLRRIPLCGAIEAQQAVAAARGALAGWQARGEAARAALLAVLADALVAYSGHFARLLVEESGADGAIAAAEVEAAVSCLRDAAAREQGGVVAIVGSPTAPLLSLLVVAVPALRAGSALVVRPSPEAPAVVFALAELTRRSGFPAGVFNVVYGGDAMIDGLCACGVELLAAGANEA